MEDWRAELGIPDEAMCDSGHTAEEVDRFIELLLGVIDTLPQRDMLLNMFYYGGPKGMVKAITHITTRHPELFGGVPVPFDDYVFFYPEGKGRLRNFIQMCEVIHIHRTLVGHTKTAPDEIRWQRSTP